MSTVLDNIRLYKHQFENGKNVHNIIGEKPLTYIKQVCINITQRCIKKVPLALKTNISNDLYRMFSQELKIKTELLQDYILENPQNKISYWSTVFDTLIRFIQTNINQNHVSWANNAAKQKFLSLLQQAQDLNHVIVHETPIEQDYDYNMGGILYIREYHGVKPASTKFFKHLMVSDEEINTVKELINIFDTMPSYFMLQYSIDNTKSSAQPKIATFIKQEDLVKHNVRLFNQQRIR